MLRNKYIGVLIVVGCLSWIFWNLASVIFVTNQNYFNPYYTEDFFKQSERLYNESQYRQKNPTSLIADEAVFRYAAGAYMRGMDPILVNSEHTPLGKYIIGTSYFLWQTETPIILFFGLMTLLFLWYLGQEIVKDPAIALVPVALFSSEQLFLNQLRVTPLLDIIQLPFIILSIINFVKEQKSKRFIFTSLSLGIVMATKTIIPTFLLLITFSLYLLFYKRIRDIMRLMLWLPISVGILVLSYTKTFLDGYNLIDFLRFQKWILLYQQSKLIFPFSFWRLMLFNEWQTWWGEMKVTAAADWTITWPILLVVPFVLLFLIIRRKMQIGPEAALLLIWVFVYEAFLSLGIITTRFLLPLLPALYMLAVFLIFESTKT